MTTYNGWDLEGHRAQHFREVLPFDNSCLFQVAFQSDVFHLVPSETTLPRVGTT
jgi:hypothetical protein